MSTQHAMNLRTATDEGRYYQSGLSRGKPVTLYRQNATTNASAVSSLILSTGFQASGTTNVFDMGPYDSCDLYVTTYLSTTATTVDIEARVCQTSNGTFRSLTRRSAAGGLVYGLPDRDRFTTTISNSIRYEKLMGPFVEFRGRCASADGKSWTATVIPYHSGGGR